jgi:hypothetical protein
MDKFVGALLLGLVAGALILPAALGADGEATKVDLKAFQFKVDEDASSLFGYNEEEGKLFFYTNGRGEAAAKVAQDGEYEIVIRASCDPAEDERAKFKLAVDGQAVGDETLLTADEAKDYKFKAKLKAGEVKLSIEFTNDAYQENEFDRNLYIHAVSFKPAG